MLSVPGHREGGGALYQIVTKSWLHHPVDGTRLRMVCNPKCEVEHYCDALLGRVCASCKGRCFINQPDPKECKRYCPEVYKRMYEADSTAATTEQAVTTVAVTPSGGLAVNLTTLGITLVCVIAAVAIIGVVVFMCCRRRRNRQKEKESTEKSDPEAQNGYHELTPTACSQSPDRRKYSTIRHETDSNQAEITVSDTILSRSLPLSTANSSSHDDMPSFLFNNGTEFKSGHRVLRNSPKPRDSLANIQSTEPLLRQEPMNDSNQHQLNIRSDAYTSNGTYRTGESPHNPNVKKSQENVSPMLDDISAVHEGGIYEGLQNGTEHEPSQLTRINTVSTNSSSVMFNFVADGPDRSLSPSPPSLPADSTGAEATTIDHSSRWAMVMKMYDAVDSQMHKFPFIAGCMIGGDALQVYVRPDKENNIESCYNQIKNILPKDPLVQELLIVQPE